MKKVSAVQHTLAQAVKLNSRLAEGIQIGPDEPDFVWVVFSGEVVVGVFKDWPSASAKVGEIERIQLRNWLELNKTSELNL